MTISVKSIAVERLGCNATSNIGNNVRHAINKRNLIEKWEHVCYSTF